MAKVVLLTDRMPGDSDWKGDAVWQVVRGLADAQHDVQVFTTEDPDGVPFVHARLNVARPATSFGVETLMKWSQAILGARPEILHTFAFKPQRRWPSLTVFPLLSGALSLFPVQRVCTFFEPQDFAEAAASSWYLASDRWTVFNPSSEAEARKHFSGRVDVAPWSEVVLDEFEPAQSERFALIPSPVSSWTHPQHGLVMLADWLRQRPDATALINGGFGSLRLSERKHAWETLGDLAVRVRMSEPLGLSAFRAYVQNASCLWLMNEPRTSWRLMMSAALGEACQVALVGAPEHREALKLGSTANFLSRLYCSKC